jgi:RHS repeat-associated protein
MLVPNRHGVDDYRYGFQGQEKDDEIKGGKGNSLNYTFRMHDPRVGRFFATDPLAISYPFYSPYAFSGNRVIDAVELEGKEPEIYVTKIETGHTLVRVYGAGNITQKAVKTYLTIVQYRHPDGKVTEIAKFNVTRDGWYDMGTNKEGKTILFNRSSDPDPDAGPLKILRTEPNKYATGVNGYVISPIKSSFDQKYNKTLFEDGLPSDALDKDVKRVNNTAQNSMFHLSSWYEHPDGEGGLGGAYGCYGVVDPLQVYKDLSKQVMHPEKTTSNKEMKAFGKAVDDAKAMQIEEHGKKADVDVIIENRDYEKVQIK